MYSVVVLRFPPALLLTRLLKTSFAVDVRRCKELHRAWSKARSKLGIDCPVDGAEAVGCVGGADEDPSEEDISMVWSKVLSKKEVAKAFKGCY